MSLSDGPNRPLDAASWRASYRTPSVYRHDQSDGRPNGPVDPLVEPRGCIGYDWLAPGGGDPEHFEPAGNCAHLTFDGAAMNRSSIRCIGTCAAMVAVCLAFWAPLPGCTVIEPLQPEAAAPAEDSATRPVSGLPAPLYEQTVPENDIVILRAIAVPESAGGSPTYVWLQVSGPVVELWGRFTPVSTFIAPVVDEDSVLVFRFHC